MFRHPRSRKILDFYKNYNFAIFPEIGNFLGLTYSTHVVPPPPSGIHFLDFAVDDDVIHMLSCDDLILMSIVLDGSYEIDGVASSP